MRQLSGPINIKIYEICKHLLNNTKTMKTSLSYSKRYWFLLIYTIILGLLMIFKPNIEIIGPGLDSSWIYAINNAALKEVAWGKEFIFPYGPYGYLIRTVDLGNHIIQRINFELFLTLFNSIVVFLFIRSFVDLTILHRYIFTSLLLYAISIQYQEWRLFSVFLLIILIGLKQNLRWAFIINGLLAGFYLLSKFSLGITAVFTLLLASLLIYKPKEIIIRLTASISAVVLGVRFFWIWAVGEFDSLGRYLLTQVELLQGYSSAMSYYLSSWKQEVIFFLIFFVILAFWLNLIRDRNIIKNLAVLAIPLFTLWKISVVRQDAHLAALSLFGLLITVIILCCSLKQGKKSPYILATVSIVVLLKASFNNSLARPALVEILFRPFRVSEENFILLNPKTLSLYRQQLAEISSRKLKKKQLSERLIRTINTASIDIYPWELSYIYANSLNWQNRPVIQSYTSYTKVLDQLNSDFIDSSKKPVYILWHHERYLLNGIGSIDGRHVLYDEPSTVMAIFDNYNYALQDKNLTLLSKRSRPRFSPAQIIKREEVAWNQWIKTPPVEKGVLTVSVTYDNSFILSFLRLLFRQPAISISQKYVTGEEKTFRLVPDTMINGILIEPSITSTDEFRSFIKDGKGGSKVMSVRFNGGLVARLSKSLTIIWLHRIPVSKTWN